MFLEFLNETVYLACGMTSDAADESMILKEHYDENNPDNIKAPYKHEAFIRRQTMLFADERVEGLAGYTKFAIQNIKRKRTFFVGKKPKSFGGPEHPTMDAKRFVYQRMMAYVKLSIHVIRAEWPHFELMNSFSALNLENDFYGGNKAVDAAEMTKFERLAKVVGSTADDVLADIQEVGRFAQAEYKRQPNAHFLDCWVQGTQKYLHGKPRGERDALVQPLRRILSKIRSFERGITCNLERGYASMNRLFGGREHTNEDVQTTILKLVKTRPAEEEVAIMNEARELYVERYGSCREAYKERVDKGVANPKRRNEKSEAGFLRARRKAVGDADLAHTPADQARAQAALEVGARAAWTDKHEDELAFNDDKHKRWKVALLKINKMITSA
jgi:hypothetical protein